MNLSKMYFFFFKGAIFKHIGTELLNYSFPSKMYLFIFIFTRKLTVGM